jgi:DNA-binding MarR family transcriptional regulator
MAMLARRMAMDRSTLHRNLRPLEQADLIAVAGRRGRRGSTVMLTESGHNALRGAMTAWQKHQTAVVGRLGEAESGRLLANLAHLSDGDPVK